MLVVRVVGDQLCEPVGVRARGCDSLEDEADPGLTEVQAPLVIVLGIVGHVLPVEIRDVVALELDEPATLQLVEGAITPEPPRYSVRRRRGSSSSSGCTGQPSSNAASASATISRIAASIAAGVPGLLEERLVALGIEESQR